MHVDNFIEGGLDKPQPDEAYARFVLNFMRWPASMQIELRSVTKEFKLFCTYKDGKVYRVTGASRMGDIWLAVNPNQDAGYDLRVGVTDCQSWSRVPVE